MYPSAPEKEEGKEGPGGGRGGEGGSWLCDTVGAGSTDCEIA